MVIHAEVEEMHQGVQEEVAVELPATSGIDVRGRQFRSTTNSTITMAVMTVLTVVSLYRNRVGFKSLLRLQHFRFLDEMFK